jgi:hypothetical protein
MADNNDNDADAYKQYQCNCHNCNSNAGYSTIGKLTWKAKIKYYYSTFSKNSALLIIVHAVVGPLLVFHATNQLTLLYELLLRHNVTWQIY